MIRLLSHNQLAIIVGKELREMRLDAGMSISEVARAMDSYKPIVSRVEGGHHLSSIEIILTQAAVCGGDPARVWRALDRAMGWPEKSLRRRRPRVRAPRRPRAP